ncbi:MAG: cell division protein ZapA [Gammaproteobacteria bacterium]|nr:cell division protein ZapA [Gammaproteobacteria bacterium]
MTIQVIGTTVEVLGKAYQVRCPENEVLALQQAALYLEEKMSEIRKVNHILSIDRIAVIAALNMTHQLLTVEHEKNRYAQMVNERLQALEKNIDASSNESDSSSNS